MPDNLNTGKGILLVGAGAMAQEYAKILQKEGENFDVVGRGAQSAAKFASVTNKEVFTGGLDSFIAMRKMPSFTKAIVATGTEALKDTAVKLMQCGVNELLIEKPGAVSLDEVNELYEFSKRTTSKLFIAYNRRFYASVGRLKEMIKEDGGVLSFNFEFTEWAHKIEPLTKAKDVKENWFFANSTHVVDLAFYLGGKPAEMSSYTAGKLSWHPVAIFAGAGSTRSGALFTYQANWQAPGRWAVEVLTKHHRFYLRPLEKLQVQQLGSVKIEDVPIDDVVDSQYKPGLFKQTTAFLHNRSAELVTLEEHMENCRYYRQMLGKAN